MMGARDEGCSAGQAGWHFGAVRGATVMLCAGVYTVAVATGAVAYSSVAVALLAVWGLFAVLDWSGRIGHRRVARMGYALDIGTVSVVTAGSAQFAGLTVPLYYLTVAASGIRDGWRTMVLVSLAGAGTFLAASLFNPALGAFPHMAAGVSMSMPVFALLLVFLTEATAGLARTFEERIQVLSRRLENANGMAARDPETGAYSRPLFLEQVKRSIAIARRCGLRVVVIVVEFPVVDDIRDIHGEQAAEAAMRGAVGVLRRALRTSDVIGRYGPSGLSICVGPVDAGTTADVVERMENVMSWLNTEFSVPGRKGEPVRIRISPEVGYAVYPDDGLTPSSLLGVAESERVSSDRPRRERTRRTDRIIG